MWISSRMRRWGQLRAPKYKEFLTKRFYTKQIIIVIFIFSQSKERRKILKFLRLLQTSEVGRED